VRLTAACRPLRTTDDSAASATAGARVDVSPERKDVWVTWNEVVWGVCVAVLSAGLSWAVARRTVAAQRASDAHVASVNALLPALCTCERCCTSRL
jgi:hypothetical protein